MVSFYNKNKNNVSKCQSATPYLLNTIPQLLITESRKWRNTNLQIWLFQYVHLLVHQRQVILQFTVVGDHETFSFSIILRTSSSAQHLQIGHVYPVCESATYTQSIAIYMKENHSHIHLSLTLMYNKNHFYLNNMVWFCNQEILTYCTIKNKLIN